MFMHGIQMYTFVHYHRLKEAHNDPHLRSEMTVRPSVCVP